MVFLKKIIFISTFIISSYSFAEKGTIEIKVNGLHANVSKIVKHNSVLFSGDSFQLEVLVSTGQHVYSFLLDSSNELTNLSSGFKIGNSSYMLPANGHWYKLDDNAGIEKLVVVGSRIPLDLSKLSSAIKNNNWSSDIFNDTTIETSSIRHINSKVVTRGIQTFSNQGEEVENKELQELNLSVTSSLPISKLPISGIISNLISFSNTPLIKTRGIKEVHVFKKAAPSVVKVFTETGSGSGSLISKEGLILTNWHVVKDAKKVGIVFMPEKGKKVTEDDFLKGEVIKINGEADLALVKIDKVPVNAKPLHITREDPEIGQDVHAIGHPKGGSDWTYTKGYISQLNYDDNWSYKTTLHKVKLMIQSQTPINPGNSGGPLLGNKGEIVGVNSSSSLDYESANYAISAEDVRAFIAQMGDIKTKAKKKKNTSKKAESLKKISKDLGVNVISVKIVDFTKEDSKDYKISIDDDKNGKVEMMVIILEDKSKGRIIIYDDNEDGIPDEMSLDEDNNGKVDLHLYFDKKGKINVVGYDDDEDGKVDRYEDYK
jgi:S1-C subfamily serine protease